METYLMTTSEKLRNNNYRDLSIVLGNESCDLDSAVSAVVYAAFLYWQHNKIKCAVCTRGYRDETAYRDNIFVPILNVDRQDYDLKTEVAFCLQQHNIDAHKLVFRNDYDLEALTAKVKTNITVVDHHVLAKKDRFLAPLVMEIIDHRPMDGKEWKYYGPETRSTIEPVGSCCSLVTQRIREVSKLVSTDIDFFTAFPVAADLLHSGIIVDTVNFSKELNKATPVDREMVLFLESILKPPSCEEDRQSKLNRLLNARKDVSQLTADQLLRKDVKIAGDILVPSFPIPVEEYFRKSNALQAVRSAMSRRDCQFALLLGMSLTDGLRRDAGILAAPAAKPTQLAEHLYQWTNPPFQLVPEELSYAKQVIYFKQLNLSASRKQYMPAVMEFLEKYKESE